MNSWIRIAHRGASAIAPENTLAAFQKAIEIGVDAVELDLHGTADGEIIAIHDATLDRTTNMSGHVRQHDLESIKQADAGAWFKPEFKEEPVPTLAESLDCITKNTVAVLEIKDETITEAVVEKIREMKLQEHVVVISFHTSVLQTVRSHAPDIPTGWLIGSSNGRTNPIQLCQQLSVLGCSLLNVNHQIITAEFAYEILRRGIALWSWTVDDIDQMRNLLEIGVQGITSNYPEYFSKV